MTTNVIEATGIYQILDAQSDLSEATEQEQEMMELEEEGHIRAVP